LVAEEFLCSFVDYKNSRMFGNLPSDVKTDLMKKNVTPNFHSYGVTVKVMWLLPYLGLYNAQDFAQIL
jgi:hypothetical protein